ncbi:NAD(P)-dependent oxidoreductase [Aerococcus urinae]|uniref:Glyoxylate reductase n=1 Tax=Aerococcus urinae TaxID=1376 RepID=A0A120I9J9_9LACT|nr:NAD(P)-dependent oxidoreductase [Aerococcus urinae]AMB95168.1 hypothetical protein AWM73_00965 [Aerococcus urinae]MCY3031885.1 glyoxylate reductase [Aerococcus urinae]MCY3037121.1 glyoxylate reductase [Aerococcus urinae]MCY3043932.1 glyoxylate reductase [Aerococcus urinae]MCY3046324.1 glyoxylate reductase [Aerococcus urinae]
MPKPILYLDAQYKDQARRQLEELSDHYQIKDKKQLNSSDYAQIEIFFGSDLETLAAIYQANDRRLAWIQLDTAGADYLPQAFMADPKVSITTVSGIHAPSIAESIYGYLLGVYHQLFIYHDQQQEKNWHRYEDVKNLTGKKALVYGTGHLASEIAQIGQAFGLDFYGVNTSGRAVEHFKATYTQESVADHIGEMDIIINTLPSTPETKNIFDRSFFNEMKEKSYFINVGRGSAVVEADLQAALEEDKIAGAYLDVFQKEPLTADSPLWETKNLLITPHSSGRVEHFRDDIFKIFYQNYQDYLKGKSLSINLLDKEKGY